MRSSRWTTSCTMPSGSSLVWRPATARSAVELAKTMPRANTSPSTGTPRRCRPRRTHRSRREPRPATGSCRAAVRARSAPSSTTIAPRASGGEGDPQLAGRQSPIVSGERGARSSTSATASASTSSRAARAMTVRIPDHDAIRAADSLLAMPPLPRPLPAAPALIDSSGSSAVTTGHQLGGRIGPWVGGVEPVEVGEQHQDVGVHGVGDQRGDAVVVAVAQLVAGDRVVLVDDRDAPQLEQPVRGCCGRAGTGCGRRSRAGRASTCAPTRPNAREVVVVDPHQPRLTDGRHGLQREHVGRSAIEPERCEPGCDGARRHQEHLMSGPRAALRSRRSAWRSHDGSMWPASSVIDDVPILATTLMTPSTSQVALVLEAELADPDDVAVLRRRRVGASCGRPSASDRWSMYDSASGVVTSLSATTRSTSRPTSRNSPSSRRSTMAPLHLGLDHDETLGLAVRSAAPRGRATPSGRPAHGPLGR